MYTSLITAVVVDVGFHVRRCESDEDVTGQKTSIHVALESSQKRLVKNVFTCSVRQLPEMIGQNVYTCRVKTFPELIGQKRLYMQELPRIYSKLTLFGQTNSAVDLGTTEEGKKEREEREKRDQRRDC